MTKSQSHIIKAAILGEAALFLIGAGLLWANNQNILSLFKLAAPDIFIGSTLALALIAMMRLLEILAPEQTEKMVQANIVNIQKMGLKLTWPAIIIVSLAAGVGEEMLFRAGLQGGIDLILPSIVAIMIANIFFTLMHPGSALMMGVLFMLGLSFGITYALTHSLIGVMLGHALYDIWAFYRLRLRMPPNTEASSTA